MARRMLTGYGKASAMLCEELVEWAQWLANESPPWAAYRGMTTRRLLGLDKEPGTRPVGIGSIWLRGICKLLLAETADEAKSTCGATQLCAGMEAGIEGGIACVLKHVKTMSGKTNYVDGSVEEAELDGTAEEEEAPAATAAEPTDDAELPGTQEFPEEEEHEDGPVVTDLVDANNGFNRLNRYAMLWTVRHRWPSMARFIFNMHRHFVRLVLRRPGKSPYVLLSKEGVIQGDPTSSFTYGIGLLPLGKRINSEHPEVASPAIADDWTLAGRAKDCAKALATICRLGPSVGYFAEAEKSYCIVAEKDEAAAKALHAAEGCNVKFTRGQRYVGGFVGGKAEETAWLTPQVDKWTQGVKALARVAWRYPQTAYAGLVWCLQAEWQYLCRVCPGVGEHLRPIEEAPRKDSIPAVLGHKGMIVSDDARKLYANGVKQGGVRHPSPPRAGGGAVRGIGAGSGRAGGGATVGRRAGPPFA